MMNLLNGIIISGVIIFLFGIIFNMQGYGIVGPEQSFMYKNPEWISHGIEITTAGTIIAVIGIILKIKSRFKTRY